ncbi:sigma-70 family RNA polymerase sigma factor [Stieleria neptunia]|nr:sigma-70 family RNA polymerase sigma factor [Stieleria neptunia]
MSESSITLILNQLRQAGTDEERQSAAAKLYRCYRGQVERVARTRLTPGGGLADEEDVAQSAFRSFFDRIETGQLDALVTGGQAWAILARLTRNKAIDSVRYDNALCRGGEGGRRPAEPPPGESGKDDSVNDVSGNGDATPSTRLNRLEPRSGSYHSGVPRQGATASGRNRLLIGDGPKPSSSRIEFASQRAGRKREDYPLDSVRDRNQRSGAEQAASNEAIERFLEQLSEATLRGIVSLKLHGFTNEEIAEQLGCATRTVERKLNLIRRLWSPILENSDEHRPT